MTTFTELVGCEVPLQLAGMGGVGASVELPAAVSEAGGLGMIGGSGISPEALDQMLDEMAEATTYPFGVNFLVPFVDLRAVVVASEKCAVAEFFYGDPDASLVELAHGGGALAAWQVGSVAEALAAVSAKCDFIVAQGTEAGGHVRGMLSRADVLSEIIRAVNVPVLAAGGIGTRKDVAEALEAGAAGVRVGTRFLVADESIAHPQYIEALIGASADDTVLTETFSLGWPHAPHRVLRSSVEAAEATDEEFVATADAGYKVSRLATSPPTKDVRGNISAMAMYARTSVAAVRERMPARDIVAQLCAGI